MSIRPFENLIPRIARSAYVDATALVTGDVEIGADSSIWPMTVIRGDINSVRIGDCTNIQDGSILHVSHDSEYAPGGFGLLLGNRVTIGHHAILHGCEIGDRCLIGIGSVVLDGARIEAGAMVAAGSLVAPGKVLEGGFLWRGRPAQRVRELTSQESNYLEYSADYYVELARRHAGCV